MRSPFVWFAVALACFVLAGCRREISPKEEMELNFSGDWENIVSGQVLSLNMENHKATVSVTQSDDKVIESVGTWEGNDSDQKHKKVVIEVNGEAGNYKLTMEMVEHDPHIYLVPSPVETALLKDTYVLSQEDQNDRDQDP